LSKKIIPFVIAVVLVSLHVAEAQSTKVPRIGYLGGTSPSANSVRIEAFRQGLRELGYGEEKNIVIEYRWAEGKFDRLHDLAAELVRLKVAVIITGGAAVTRAAK
jgi:putative tryptophan/tyrosine transport system substrate-binding protein